jgi:hypothetical protein
MSKTSSNSPAAYVLRANIKETNPPIWRELSVPADYTLGDLHGILQIAFGWGNDHMHAFTVKSVEYGMTDLGFDDMGAMEDTIDEDSVCLYDLKLRRKQKFSYLYDFGDSWEHEIVVSDIIPAGDEERDLAKPRCLGGERAGPPEDVGGVWGYERMLEIAKDPGHEEYKEIHEWIGNIDPEYIDIAGINANLKRAFKSGSK